MKKSIHYSFFLFLLLVFISFRFIEPKENTEIQDVKSLDNVQRELLNRKIFNTFLEVRVLLESWWWEYNCYRPHSFLQYRPRDPEAFSPNILSLKVLH